ncbi:hypothetical protein PINS_up006217 [Pythium insidiosum]|nr:hypothetical protein PINS_up006217 [Pythium insidiosum]
MADHPLKSLSLHEKLSYFYCAYVREETVDPDVDVHAVRLWEKIKVSRRKCRERVAFLLQHVENVSQSQVRHLDSTYRAKRELILLAEGTIGPASSGRADNVLAQVESARINNELLQDCGALSVFSQHLQRSIHAFRTLNFQHLDVDQVDTMIRELQQDMVLMFMLILFNANRQNASFDRQLLFLGTSAPTYTLVAIIDCLIQMNVLPGFPIKRLLMLFHEWFAAILGDSVALDKLKLLRKSRHPDVDKNVLADETSGLRLCKSFKEFTDPQSAALDPQDAYYLQKKRFAKIRREIHDKYRHRPHHEMKSKASSDVELTASPIHELDDEWEARCELVYQLLLPRMHDLTAFLSNLVILSCGSALNARDKKTFYSRRSSAAEQMGYGLGDFAAHMDGAGMGEAGADGVYWKWILREKAIVLDLASALILLMLKQFRCSHVCKGEYVAHFFLDANLVATLTKFMNKDLATYLQVARQEGDDQRTGLWALEIDLMRKSNIRSEDNQNEFAIQPTRIITSILRILQKMTKRKPNVIKNALCRSSSIVWLKRVVSLGVPVPRLYALKLVKSQAKYLGHQWVRKYTCFNLLTDVYIHVRPELDDDWLRYEDEDLSKPPQQDSVERLLFGEMQAYHHKHYWETFGSKPLPTGASIVVEAFRELDSEIFDPDGGRLSKNFQEIKLDPVQFCQQYEKWLDAEGIKAESTPESVPLPIF